MVAEVELELQAAVSEAEQGHKADREGGHCGAAARFSTARPEILDTGFRRRVERDPTFRRRHLGSLFAGSGRRGIPTTRLFRARLPVEVKNPA